METGRRALGVVLVGTLLLTGCTTGRHPPSRLVSATPIAVAWRKLPLPADPRGKPDIRALAHCRAGWFAGGALDAGDGIDKPALWFSADLRSWSALPIKTRSVYGGLNALYSVACNDEHVVAVGAAIGGVHGNPRTSTWQGPADGTGPLTEVRAAFQTYGGPDAIGVGQVAGGPRGFVIVGGRIDANRKAGAAVWFSPSGAAFDLIDGDPQLESGAFGTTEVHGVYAGPDGFVAVGGVTPPGSPFSARDTAVWTSLDGVDWHREVMNPTAADNVLERVTSVGDQIVAVGPDGSAFTAWTASPDGHNWKPRAVFGQHGAVTGVPDVVGLAPAVRGQATQAVVFDGASYALWRGDLAGGAWAQIALPTPTAKVTGLASDGVATLLATNDGLWSY